MSTGFYLVDQPLVRSQYRQPRRAQPTGAVGVHTAESIMDDVGPDTGAENVASYITRRTDPGSYHTIVDSDSAVRLVPDDAEAFSIAVDGLNRSTWNISFACATTDLHPDEAWTRSAFRIAAAEIAAYWRRTGIDPTAAIRWLTRSEVLSGRAGLFHHGTVQPASRHDAFTRNPHRARLEALLCAEIAAHHRQPVTTPEDPHMSAEDVAQLKAHIDAKFAVAGWDDVALSLNEVRARGILGGYVAPNGAIYAISTDANGRPVRLGFRDHGRQGSAQEDVEALKGTGALPDPLPQPDPATPLGRMQLAGLNRIPEIPYRPS